MILRHLILGLLTLAPMTGYDLKQRFDSSVHYFWSADKAQIYRSLAILVDEGLVTVHPEPGQAGPMRQVHRITAAGRRELHRWLVGELDEQPARSAFLARVFFAADLNGHETAVLLNRRRDEAQALLLTLTEIRASFVPPYDRAVRLRLATVDNGIRHARAELEWLDHLEKEL